MIIIITTLLLSTLHEVALGRPQETAGEDDSQMSVFKGYDQNGNGKVSAEEIREYFKNSGKKESDTRLATTSMTKFDIDNDGLLNEEEFQIWFDDDDDYSPENSFKSYDSNGDDMVSAEEVREYYKADEQDESEIRLATTSMTKFDVDNDGFLNKEEFQIWFDDNDYYYSPENSFKSYDSNGDDMVSAEEVIEFYKADEQNESDIRLATTSMRKFDVDNDGLLNEEEFQLWFDDTDYFYSPENSFKSHDINGDSKISAEEVRAFSQGSGENEKMTEEAVFSLAAFDDDTDGLLNEDEFQRWFERDYMYLFRAMDQDGDQGIQKSEYSNVLKRWGYADEVIERRTLEHFKEFDANKDEAWDFEEFKLWNKSPSTEVELQEYFTITDTDSNQVISEEEFKMYWTRIGAPELALLDPIDFKEDDSDGDGRISPLEYAAVYNLRG